MSKTDAEKRTIIGDLIRTKWGREILANSMIRVPGHVEYTQEKLDELRSKHRERINYLDSPAGKAIEKAKKKLEHKVIGKVTGLRPPQRDKNKGE